jgi:large subunit ribosomal protein L18e
VKKSETTNPELVELIRFLRKQSNENKAEIWRDVAERLTKARRRRIAVNLSRLSRYTQKNETAAVPGKVLGSGELVHPITIAAFAFSAEAKKKIATANGKCLSFPDLIKKNPTGSKVKIIG